jgi:simple sugar transport system permease protein
MKGGNIVFQPKPVPIIFGLLACAGLYLSNMGLGFVANEVITRFVRDGVMVLALILPIQAGMGINFSIVVGALCAQVGLILALDFGLVGVSGLMFMAGTGLVLALALGLVIGICLNRVRGREMITTIIMGFFATSIYQLVFMVGYGTLIRPGNEEIMLSRGVGIRNMVDLGMFRGILDTLWLVEVGPLEFPVFMIIAVCVFALGITYLTRTRLGKAFFVVGQDSQKAVGLGIDVDRTRIKAILLSTLIACLGHLFYILNIGMLNVYTAHMNTDIFSCAALLAGGASLAHARVSHAFWGILLFHTLFIVSPQAGQNLFGNPALGEYFRSFVAYGTIAFALVANEWGKDRLR